MPRIAKRALIVALSSAVCLAILLSAEAVYTLRSCERCFALLAELKPGHPAAPYLEELRDSPFVFASGPCDKTDCAIGFNFETWLSFRVPVLAQRRAFVGNVRVTGGNVAWIHYHYFQGSTVVASVTDGASPDPGLSVVALDARKRRVVAHARGFADSPVTVRRVVLRPDVSCLIRIGGCTDGYKVLTGAQRMLSESSPISGTADAFTP
jgi:hypothetical protein